MSDFHKELVTDLFKDWSLVQLETYIHQLEQRRVELDDWIKHVKTIRRKRMRKTVFDNGVRGGS